MQITSPIKSVFFHTMLKCSFLLSVLLLPFNALPWFHFIFRELAVEGFFYGMLLFYFFSCLYFFQGNAFYFKLDFVAVLLFLLFAWSVLSGLFNFLSIIIKTTKGRTGFEKFIFQQMVLCFFIIWTFLVLGNLNIDGSLKTIFLKVNFTALLLVCFVGFLELFASLGIQQAQEAVLFIRKNINFMSMRSLELGGEINFSAFRVHSVSGEPSWMAMYLAFSFPFALVYQLQRQRILGAILVFVSCFLLVLFSLSRTAVAIFMAEILLCIFSLRSIRDKQFLSIWRRFVCAILVIFVLSLFWVGEEYITKFFEVFQSLFKDERSGLNYISNIGRKGSQLAAFRIGLDNPYFGVGLGQFGFYAPQYYPYWSWESIEIQHWADASLAYSDQWAPVHGLYARLFSDLGFIGLFIWLALMAFIGVRIYRSLSDKCGDVKGRLFYGALLVSWGGVCMSGLNLDSLRFGGYWLLMILSEPERRKGVSGIARNGSSL